MTDQEYLDLLRVHRANLLGDGSREHNIRRALARAITAYRCKLSEARACDREEDCCGGTGPQETWCGPCTEANAAEQEWFKR